MVRLCFGRSQPTVAPSLCPQEGQCRHCTCSIDIPAPSQAASVQWHKRANLKLRIKNPRGKNCGLDQVYQSFIRITRSTHVDPVNTRRRRHSKERMTTLETPPGDPLSQYDTVKVENISQYTRRNAGQPLFGRTPRLRGYISNEPPKTWLLTSSTGHR